MPSQKPLHAPTAYELRKRVVDPATAKMIFDRDFALAAFGVGVPGRQSPDRRVVITQSAADLIEKVGHADLAWSCLAFLLSIESGHERLEETGFLALIRQIRDAAATITLAADELTDQLVRHDRETGYYEQLRGRALYHMALALHGRWARFVPPAEFMLQTIPKRDDNPLSDGRWQHGLSLAGLYNEADNILKNYERISEEMQRGGMSVVASGNRADHERDAFVRDLAEIYERVFERKPSGRDAKNGMPSPFVRFVNCVFKEFPATHDVDLRRYRPPSSGTVRTILAARVA